VNPELDNKLCADFPLLYAQRHKPMTETCMCWGFECGDGWEPLIRELSQQLEWLNATGKVRVEAVQVKEKFGTLRFYTVVKDCADDFPWRMVDALCDAAEARSACACEECGRWGERRVTASGWVYTSCEEHALGEEQKP